MSSNPGTMLDRLSTKPPPAKCLTHILPDRIALSLALLKSLFPNYSELRDSNITFNTIFSQLNNISIAAKRYINYNNRIYEI